MPDAHYDRIIDLDLGSIEPNVALPHSPDNVKKIREVAGIKVDQVLIGSCTNSSYKDLMTTAALLKGKKVNPDVSFGVVAGSRQVLRMITANGALTDIVDSGARILESACGFCVGYGQSPHSGAVSVRTNNRNFEGRSGTKDAQGLSGQSGGSGCRRSHRDDHRPARSGLCASGGRAAGAVLRRRQHVHSAVLFG